MGITRCFASLEITAKPIGGQNVRPTREARDFRVSERLNVTKTVGRKLDAGTTEARRALANKANKADAI